MLFREDAPVDPRRAEIVAQVGRHPPGPRIARARLQPRLALRHLGVLELVQRQVFRLALDGEPVIQTSAAPAAPPERSVQPISVVVTTPAAVTDRGGLVWPRARALLRRPGCRHLGLPSGGQRRRHRSGPWSSPSARRRRARSPVDGVIAPGDDEPAGDLLPAGLPGQRLAERDVGGRLLAGRQDGCFACWQVGGEDAVELAGLDAEPVSARLACGWGGTGAAAPG